MRYIFAFLFVSILYVPCFAQDDKDIIDFNTAMQMDRVGDEQNAAQIYYGLLGSENEIVSLNSALALAQKFVAKEDFESAVKYYRWILQQKPDFAQARFELALCYMKLKYWNQADYQLRLALSAPDLPDNIKQLMMYYRFLIRQNKNWNVWFNFGAAPDNNVNYARGGEECINTIYGVLCRQLPEPEKAVGFNFSVGGNYEFTLSDSWRWKNEALIYSNTYNKHKYDDLYAIVSSGPRYIWDRGDVWVAGVLSRRWYGWDGYNWAYGAKIDSNYDFSRRLSGGLLLRVTENFYDLYAEYMNGETYTVAPRLSYTFGGNKRIILRTYLDRETTKDSIYANWREGFSIGFDINAPWGFNFYFEPWFSWAQYDSERFFVKDNNIDFAKERDFIQRYSFGISNSNISKWGFVPALNVGYINQKSNIPQRNYDKVTIGLTLHQSF